MTVLASETWTGANGAAWPAQWTLFNVTANTTADIQNNTGRMFVNIGGYANGPRAYLSGMTAVADSDFTISFTTAADLSGEPGYFRVGVRTGGTFTGFTPNIGYFAEFCPSPDSVNFGYFVLRRGNNSSSPVSLGSAIQYAFAASTAYKIRIRAVGSAIKMKLWLASASEPSTWNFEVTDTTWTAAGKVSLTSAAGAESTPRGVYWDDLVVTDTAAPAPAASVSWQSEVSPTALQLGWILDAGTSVRAVGSLTSDYATKIYGDSITRPASGWCTSRITGLAANTLYYTGVEVDGVFIATGRGQYRTLRTDLVASKVITSSCIGDATLNGPIYARLVSESAAFFVQQGDIHYWDATTEALWREGFTSALTGPGVSAMLASVGMPYFWNNHDWGGDDSSGSDPGITTSVPAALRELSAATVYPDSRGLWRTWVHAGVRYINIDPYAHRNARTDPDTSAKTMLGATQKAWLLNLLATATEPAIIVFSGYANNPTGRWGWFPNERDEIGAAIAAIPAAQRNKSVFVGGDTHSICADDGTNAMWGRPSLNASPMQGTGNTGASGAWNITNIGSDSAHGYYSRLTFTPASGALDMTWDAVRDDGVVMATWSTSFPTAPLSKAKVGATTVDNMRVGSAFASKAYVGSVQVWP